MNVHTHIDTLINRDNRGCILVLEYFRIKEFDLMISKFSISCKILGFVKGNCGMFWKRNFFQGRYLGSVTRDAGNLLSSFSNFQHLLNGFFISPIPGTDEVDLYR